MGHGDRTPEPKPIRQLLEEDENLTFEGSLEDQEMANTYLDPTETYGLGYLGGQDRFAQEEEAKQQAIDVQAAQSTAMRHEYYDARYRALELSIRFSNPHSSMKTILERATSFLEFLQK